MPPTDPAEPTAHPTAPPTADHHTRSSTRAPDAVRARASRLARFDGVALQAPPLVADAAARPSAALRAWCLDGALAGAAGQPAARPWDQAWLRAAGGADAVVAANRFACEVDGSLRLAQCTPVAGLAWRLRLKLAEATGWRRPRAEDPWDAGWARTDAAGLAQLARHFVPRRCTLVLAPVAQAPALQPVVAALAARAPQAGCALRWLWVGGVDWPDGPDGPDGPEGAGQPPCAVFDAGA